MRYRVVQAKNCGMYYSEILLCPLIDQVVFAEIATVDENLLGYV